MVDRIQRDAASRVLRSFIDGAITNGEFEAQFPRSEEDSALPAIKANVWMLYSDLHRHKLTGKHEPNAETRALLERCVLFLETNLEFEWPVPNSACRISFRTYGCKRKLGWEVHRVGRLRSHVREMKTCGHLQKAGRRCVHRFLGKTLTKPVRRPPALAGLFASRCWFCSVRAC